MTPEDIDIAAGMLTERRRLGSQGERLPDGCRPHSVDEALSIQDAVTVQWCELMVDSIGAWKCSLPTADKTVAAPIYTRTIDSVSPISIWPKGEKARIEPELAFFLGRDFPPRPEPYLATEIDEAIVRTHMALELINSRYREPAQCGFPEMLADGLVNQGLFIGAPVDNLQAQCASEFEIRIASENNQPEIYAGKHPNGLPRAPLYWLVEFLRARGQGILAGQAVITGSYAGVIEVPLNTNIHINYLGLGEMSLCFNARHGY